MQEARGKPLTWWTRYIIWSLSFLLAPARRDRGTGWFL